MIKLNNTPYGKNRKNFNVLKKFFKKVSKLYELNLDISAKDKRTVKGKENILKTSFTEDGNDCSLSSLINSYSFMVKYEFNYFKELEKEKQKFLFKIALYKNNYSSCDNDYIFGFFIAKNSKSKISQPKNLGVYNYVYFLSKSSFEIFCNEIDKALNNFDSVFLENDEALIELIMKYVDKSQQKENFFYKEYDSKLKKIIEKNKIINCNIDIISNIQNKEISGYQIEGVSEINKEICELTKQIEFLKNKKVELIKKQMVMVSPILSNLGNENNRINNEINSELKNIIDNIRKRGNAPKLFSLIGFLNENLSITEKIILDDLSNALINAK